MSLLKEVTAEINTEEYNSALEINKHKTKSIEMKRISRGKHTNIAVEESLLKIWKNLLI